MNTQLTEKCLVTLRYDRAARGRIARLGPEQSIVRWANGNETTVVNTWVEPLPDDDKLAPLPKMKKLEREAEDHAAQVEASRSFIEAQRQREAKPKRPPPDDDIVDRLKALTPEQVKAFAVANDVWNEAYDALPNPGLIRMNIVNRTRAKTRKGYKVVW